MQGDTVWLPFHDISVIIVSLKRKKFSMNHSALTIVRSYINISHGPKSIHNLLNMRHPEICDNPCAIKFVNWNVTNFVERCVRSSSWLRFIELKSNFSLTFIPKNINEMLKYLTCFQISYYFITNVCINYVFMIVEEL